MMKIHWNYLTAIARKDLLEVRQNRAAWLPMLIVPLIFILVLPLATIFIPSAMGATSETLTQDADLEVFLANMPPSFKESLEGLEPIALMVKVMLGYFMAPMFLIFPIMFSTIIAAESFAGERERKTLEALLYTAASDLELFLGKVLAAMLPALGLSWGSFLLYTVVLNAAGYNLFGGLWFPLATWWPLIFWISPGLALLGTSATVLISAKTPTFMGAYQSSASLVLVVIGFLVGQATGVLYLSVGVGMIIGLGVWIIAAVLTGVAIGSFQRSRLLVQAAN